MASSTMKELIKCFKSIGLRKLILILLYQDILFLLILLFHTTISLIIEIYNRDITSSSCLYPNAAMKSKDKRKIRPGIKRKNEKASRTLSRLCITLKEDNNLQLQCMIHLSRLIITVSYYYLRQWLIRKVIIPASSILFFYTHITLTPFSRSFHSICFTSQYSPLS